MNDPIETLIDNVTDAALAPGPRDGVNSERALIRAAIAAQLKPALRAADILVAWSSAELSEGQASKLLQIDRITLREMRLHAIARSLVEPDDAPAIIASMRARAIERLDTWVEEYATDRCSVSEGQTIRTFWKRARANEDFLQRLDDWRSLCPPGVALFSSDGDKG